AMGDRSNRLPPDQEYTVAADESVTLTDDPATCSRVPLTPGRYQMTAHLGIAGSPVVSNAVEVTIEAPTIGHLPSQHCALAGDFAQAFAVSAGRAGIYARDTASQRADASVFAHLGGPQKAKGLAVAIHVQPGIAGRWVAWLEEAGLGAAAAMGAGASATP